MANITYFPEGGIMDPSYFPYYGRKAQVSNGNTHTLSLFVTQHQFIRLKCLAQRLETGETDSLALYKAVASVYRM